MEGSVVETLLEVFLALLSPVALTILSVSKLTVVAILESLVKNGYSLNWVLREHTYHLLAHFAIHFLNISAANLIEFLSV
jgi:hypothetical protein